MANTLRVIGTGIRLGQITLEAQQAAKEADVVLAVMADRTALEMLRLLNANVKDLGDKYRIGHSRLETYTQMAEVVMAELRSGKSVCLALYGHPIVFGLPTTLAMEAAIAEGFSARVIPGISAEDMVFADLLIDPATYGCSSYAAETFIREDRSWDPKTVLLLWQVSVMGETRHVEAAERDISLLVPMLAKLEAVYGPKHPAIFYEAPFIPYFDYVAYQVPIRDIVSQQLRDTCTLVVPPIHRSALVAANRLSEGPPVWAAL